MLSIVYSSAATTPFAAADLSALLEQSRAVNAREGLTGLLLYRDGRFLQLLEGPDDRVHDRMAAIQADPRHERLRVLLEDDVDERRFPEWTMGYEAAGDRLSSAPGYRRTFDDIDSDRSAAGTLPALRALMEWFREGRSGATA